MKSSASELGLILFRFVVIQRARRTRVLSPGTPHGKSGINTTPFALTVT